MLQYAFDLLQSELWYAIQISAGSAAMSGAGAKVVMYQNFAGQPMATLKRAASCAAATLFKVFKVS